ncbi:hypothetical protein FNV43_RR25678 [Rhamnella rubrinervis]|uniref:Transmembrane protein n=1 Tax=Rhamnella rubrinervis TaxID=2594499 RepID=A0A8K0GNL2_9ROSA|nr:hypothetical protein FNV43_RR25678 [Rhamnella rubrinervis]
MDIQRISAAAILIVFVFIITNSSTRAADDDEREVESGKPWFSDKFRNLISFSFSTSSPVTTSYWGKLKTLINQAHAYFFPPNIEGGGEEAEATVNDGDGSAGKKVKEAVAKSLAKSRATVEDSAKSAAKVAKEKLKKSLSSKQPLRSEL